MNVSDAETDHAQRAESHTDVWTYTDALSDVQMGQEGVFELSAPCSVLVHWSTARQQLDPGSACAPLAIRWALNGQRYFRSGQERFAVDDTDYLIFNAGKQFSSFIRSATYVECFTVCFDPDMSADVLRTLVTSADRLLDDPFSLPSQPVAFVEKSYVHDASVSPILRTLQLEKSAPHADHGWFAEQFRLLIEGMVRAHRTVLREIDDIPAVRPSTRVELYRRLHRARDFMESGLETPLSIPQIAGACFLSPHHFLRLFARVFGETPHQYLTRRRIDRARQLLTHTNRSVTEICYAIGFSSLGSFSSLFSRRVGVSPERFRYRCRASGVYAVRPS